MSEPLPVVYLARHGETAWSISGQHTGLTDLAVDRSWRAELTAAGRSFKSAEFQEGVLVSAGNSTMERHKSRERS